MFEVTESWLMPANIAIVVIFALFFFLGMHKGLLRTAVSLIGTLVSFYGAWFLSSVVTKYIRLWPRRWAILQDTPYAETAVYYMNQICWLLIIFVFFRLLFAIIDKVAEALGEIPVIDLLNDIGGGAVGVVEAALLCVIFTISLGTPLFENGSMLREQTFLEPVNQVTGLVFKRFVGPVLNGEALQHLYEQGTELSEEQRQRLEKWLEDNGFEAAGDISCLPDLEYEVVNEL